MLYGIAYVPKATSFENALDYEAFVPLFIDIFNIDIPEKPLVQTVDEFSVLFRGLHPRTRTASDASIALLIDCCNNFTSLRPHAQGLFPHRGLTGFVNHEIHEAHEIQVEKLKS